MSIACVGASPHFFPKAGSLACKRWMRGMMDEMGAILTSILSFSFARATIAALANVEIRGAFHQR
ncbi:hypothetical protein WT39_03385 [Burkholderia territorii]|nr:hypothetical protein WT39_03385 [Burkholderia territorii]